MTFRRFHLGLLFAVLVLALPAGARASQVFGDFDRDGRKDSATLDPDHSSSVQIWLSSTNSLRVIEARRPLARLAVFDLDGDGHPEIVAADTSAGLHVWRGTSHGKMRRYTPRRSLPYARSATPTNVEDDGNAADGPMAGTSRALSPFDAAHPALSSLTNAPADRLPPFESALLDGTALAVSSRGPPRSLPSR